MKKPRSRASPTIVLQLASLLSNVAPFPMTNKELFALVSATFIRLVSRRKPMVLRFGPDLTQDKMIISFS
jgi:hypothetical protein